MLREKIKKDLKEALKAGRKEEVEVLRFLDSLILNAEKEKRRILAKEKDLSQEELERESRLEDEEVVQVIASEIKKRKDAIEDFKRGERKDLVEKEEKGIEILGKYLPEQLSEEKIREKARKIIEEVGAKDIKDMGEVMGRLMEEVKGRASGGMVSSIVKDLLS